MVTDLAQTVLDAERRGLPWSLTVSQLASLACADTKFLRDQFKCDEGRVLRIRRAFDERAKEQGASTVYSILHDKRLGAAERAVLLASIDAPRTFPAGCESDGGGGSAGRSAPRVGPSDSTHGDAAATGRTELDQQAPAKRSGLPGWYTGYRVAR